MQITYKVVIADTSCFILLDKIGELELLKSLFNHIVTTTVIAHEFGAVLHGGCRQQQLFGLIA